MRSILRSYLVGIIGLALAATPSITAAADSGSAPISVTDTAPGAPGTDAGFLPATKSGFGTAHNRTSKVWFTVQKDGGLGEIFYPNLSSPAARALQFVVADRNGGAVRASQAAEVRTSLSDQRSLAFRQTFTEKSGRWRLEASYATDPARATVLVDVRFTSADRRRYAVYALYESALSNTRTDDSGHTAGRALLASDSSQASALVGSPAFGATSSGFRGISDGYTDLLADGRLDWHYASAAAGNLVQTAATGLTGGRTEQHATLALAFGPSARAARSTAQASLDRGYASAFQAYVHGWHAYLAGLPSPPASLRSAAERRVYRVSVMVLAASEDKTYRGAFIASPSAPWAFGRDDPSGPYHLVWSRDLYQIATGLIAAGDRAAANRAVDYLFTVQQKADGSFPQNSRVDGTPVWGGLQLDEVAFPIILAHQLRRFDAGTWAGVKRAADFLIGFEQDGNRAPWTPAERWENQSGYSPATIASEVAGLVCAAAIARHNGDRVSEQRYLNTADAWQARVKEWVVTTNGPYSDRPYFLRLTKDGNPNAGTTYTIGDTGPVNVDQRSVVDGGYLDLVRLGVLPADDEAVVNTLGVIDEQLGVPTRHGLYWQRASFDGYGEKLTGEPWDFGLPDGSRLTRGRAWPLLNGERGEYQIAAGQVAAARAQIARMARTAGPGAMLPEQVWDRQPPAGADGFVPGRPTTSATPLAWTHAQYLRLVRNVQAERVTEQPAVVAQRYGSSGSG
ncbi:MAG TPA: glycoside hydrolase family 15 protein [Kineosporiaceae bacterium]|nr:glycoside hydrolase family 15 protein [Kineosporiaceae bacterium]